MGYPLWLIPVLPLAGFLALIIGQRYLSRTLIASVGIGAVALAALAAGIIGIDFIRHPPPGHILAQPIAQWMTVAGFNIDFALYLDPLSLVMMWIVTGVGFLIHWYSAEFMRDDDGYARFFAYMNLFVAAMLILVLADNLLFLYMGWEGVGLASYLLIGFWYRNPANGAAARKAFVITRVGDTAMVIGLFLLFTQLGSLDIQTLMQRATTQWPVGSGLAIAAAALLLGGALGKSAQLPLQTWLPDAMAGPTPVSALIHAATMVTAGVYLIARTHVLFELAPAVQTAVAVIGAATLLMAAFAALTQSDIKRILAYSTMSQIGYMFLALGVGAWSAAVFHLMTHAFFKALLFLSAGAVITALHHEHNIFKMGGLYRRMPMTFAAFVIGAASLAALPVITAGFYSKDLILWHVWASPQGNMWLWGAGLLGALLTGIYIFRLVFIAFFGDAKTEIGHRPGYAVTIPLLILSLLSIGGGWIELPPTLGNAPMFSEFLENTLATPIITDQAGGLEPMLQVVAALTSVMGILLAWALFLRNPGIVRRLLRIPAARDIHRLWQSGWGFDVLFQRFIVGPLVWLATANRNDAVDAIYRGTALLAQLMHYLLVRTQTGQTRLYAAGVATGAVVVVAITTFT